VPDRIELHRRAAATDHRAGPLRRRRGRRPLAVRHARRGSHHRGRDRHGDDDRAADFPGFRFGLGDEEPKRDREPLPTHGSRRCRQGVEVTLPELPRMEDTTRPLSSPPAGADAEPRGRGVERTATVPRRRPARRSSASSRCSTAPSARARPRPSTSPCSGRRRPHAPPPAACAGSCLRLETRLDLDRTRPAGEPGVSRRAASPTARCRRRRGRPRPHRRAACDWGRYRLDVTNSAARRRPDHHRHLQRRLGRRHGRYARRARDEPRPALLPRRRHHDRCASTRASPVARRSR
jgi:hypothetical protein